MKSEELAKVLDEHRKWLQGVGGARANLTGADLTGAILSGADLSDAILSRADLSRADLSRADLSRANLSDANLSRADLSGADLTGADLTGAILSDAILSRADLTGAILSDAIGNMREIKSLQLDHWPVAYTAEVMQIGCENHPIVDWWAFDDERINRMDRRALEWWRKWKPILRQIIEASPATPTGREK